VRTRAVEFFFDYGSPFSYLADTQLADLKKRTGATVPLAGTAIGEASPVAFSTAPRSIGRYTNGP
jgi:2-hydroxychromene-2-carboxylate isomerase